MTSIPHAPKPRHLGPDYGSQWQDATMARAYPHRPPYAEALFAVLVPLLAADAPARVLDIGAGTGDLARPLAGRVQHVDALEPSAAMIAVGRTLEGGRATNLRWLAAPLETAALDRPYGLAVAGESIHWTNWDVVFPRVRAALAPGAVLALVERREADMPWSAELRALIGRYSTNQDYRPFALVEGLEARGHFEVLGRARTADAAFTQTREDTIEALHSRNGFSRARMGVSAHVFDAGYRDLLMRHGVDDEVHLTTWSEVTWGRPLG